MHFQTAIIQHFQIDDDTLDTYTRYIPDMGREDGDRLERILGDSRQVDGTVPSVSRNNL